MLKLWFLYKNIISGNFVTHTTKNCSLAIQVEEVKGGLLKTSQH